MSRDYGTYLASREWALKREAVRRRSGNKCERCEVNPMDACHHLNYANVGNEDLDDLMAICNGCHEYLSGKTDLDPAFERELQRIQVSPEAEAVFRRLYPVFRKIFKRDKEV